MIFHTKTKLEAVKAKNYLLSLLGKDIEIKPYRKTRTSSQNKARWLYLEWVADELNNQGQTYDVPYTEYQVMFTKDILYHNYWQVLRGVMFPEKKKQLNTKEFGNLVENVQRLFAELFEISINFPDWRNM